MKTREDIIADMCYVWRHDYGLNRVGGEGPGMSQNDRGILWDRMAQLYDNTIANHIDLKQSYRDQFESECA